MSEENNEVQDTVEDKAREMGWKPQDEYEGDNWVSAETFVARKPLFDKIEQEKRQRQQLERQLEQNNKALRELGEHNKKIAENAYKRALNELKSAKKEALRDGEALLAEEIQERIDELKPEAVPEVPVVNPIKAKVEAWVEQNTWYRDNIEMRNVADGIANTAIAQGKSPDEVFEIVEKKIKKMYQEEFEPVQKRNSNKDDAPPVETRTAAGGKKASKFRPTDEQRRFAKAFAASGAITEEEYYKQLAEDLGE
jgi:hypothetical protein